MAELTRKKVLVVEDDRDIREAVGDLLRDEGYDVTLTENGAIALRHLQASSDLPQIILLDMSMPVMDGYTFRTEQVKDPRLAAIPTAVISANANVDAKASSVGLTEHLKKPVDLNDLLALVEKYCRAG